MSMTMLALSGGGEVSHHRLPPPPPPTAAAAVTAAEDFYRNRPAALIAASQFPYIVPSLPFLSRMPLPPHTSNTSSSFTEHLFKLASISRPMQVVHHAAASPSAAGAQDLSAPLGVALSSPSPSSGGPPPSHHPHTVLSAMLGHHHRPVPVPGGVFPVFGSSVLPTSMFPQHPLPPRSEERPSSPITSTGEGYFLLSFFKFRLKKIFINNSEILIAIFC